MTAQQKLTAKIGAQTTASLKEMAIALYTDSRDGAEIVFSAILDTLMRRLSEKDFVAFCSAMEG